jgi:hypothetical protein
MFATAWLSAVAPVVLALQQRPVELVLAWTGEQIMEQHNAIAVASFFTRHFPHHRLLPTRRAQASSAAIAPALVENL